MSKRVLIVGGVAGGAACAARLRRMDEQAEIVIFDRGSFVSFANCGLPYFIGGVIEKEKSLLVADEKLFKDRFNIDVHTETEVVAIDRERLALVVGFVLPGRFIDGNVFPGGHIDGSFRSLRHGRLADGNGGLVAARRARQRRAGSRPARARRGVFHTLLLHGLGLPSLHPGIFLRRDVFLPLRRFLHLCLSLYLSLRLHLMRRLKLFKIGRAHV